MPDACNGRRSVAYPAPPERFPRLIFIVTFMSRLWQLRSGPTTLFASEDPALRRKQRGGSGSAKPAIEVRRPQRSAQQPELAWWALRALQASAKALGRFLINSGWPSPRWGHSFAEEGWWVLPISGRDALKINWLVLIDTWFTIFVLINTYNSCFVFWNTQKWLLCFSWYKASENCLFRYTPYCFLAHRCSI